MAKLQYKFNGNEREQKLFAAIEEGSLFKVRRYYDHYYSSISARNVGGKKGKISKLLLATLCQHPSVVNFLLNYKYDGLFDLHDWNEDGQNPLIEAIKSGNQQIVKVMAKAISNNSTWLGKSFKDAQGNTPLHYVGEINDAHVRKAMVKLLIDAGLCIEFENDKGKKPKHFDEMLAIYEASKNRFLLGTLSRLFLRKTTMNVKELYFALGILSLSILGLWLNPLFVVISLSVVLSHSVISMLMSDVDNTRRAKLQKWQDRADCTNTIERGKLTSEKLTKDLVVERTLSDLFEGSVKKDWLMLAARAGKVEQIQLLLENIVGMKINNNVVCEAIERGHLPAVRFLVSKAKGLLLNKQASSRMLGIAVLNDQPDILSFLLEKGAKIPTDIRFHDEVRSRLAIQGKLKIADYSLLDLAKEKGNKRIIKLIEDALRPAKQKSAKVVTPHFANKRQNTRAVKNNKTPVLVDVTRKQSLGSVKR